MCVYLNVFELGVNVSGLAVVMAPPVALGVEGGGVCGNELLPRLNVFFLLVTCPQQSVLCALDVRNVFFLWKTWPKTAIQRPSFPHSLPQVQVPHLS